VLEMMARRIPVFAQGFVVDGTRKLLLVNRSVEAVEVELDGLAGARLQRLDQSRPTSPVAQSRLDADRLTLEGLAIAVATLAE
jgi:hypothetical protein